MITVYICNSIEDIAAFTKMFPEACWSNDSLLNLDTDFTLHRSPPIALYKRPNVNMVSWSSVHDAESHLQFSPSSYTLGTLQPLLDLAAVFVTFLKHNNAYDKYIDSFDPNFSNNIDLQASKLISKDFYWRTSFGYNYYWRILNYKWEKLITHFNIDPDTVLVNVLAAVKEYK